MSLLHYLKPVPTLNAERVRYMLDRSQPGGVNLVDVRQLREYESGHIPGARWVPVGDLQNRFSELDPNKPTVTY